MGSRVADSKEAVLQAAIRAFAAGGYAGTSVQEILAATRLSKPTLYYHFGSKEGLFRAILDYAYDESFRRIQAAAAKGSCTERLVNLTASLFDFAEEHQDLMRLVFATVFAARSEIPCRAIDAEKRRRSFDFVLQLVREGRQAGELDAGYDAKELTHGVYGAISHQIRMHLLYPGGPLDRARAKRVVALFLDGARKRKLSL